MNIVSILKNPLFKVVGVSAVLYFALFANKENPESLGNRLSAQNIKKNLGEAKEKTQFIATNLKAAKEYQAEQKKLQTSNMAKISVEDIEAGNGELIAMCGDQVEITYGLYTKENKPIERFDSIKFTIGEITQNAIVQKNISGMKEGGIRFIHIPYNFNSLDSKLEEHLKFYKNDLIYQITLLKLTRLKKSEMKCD